MLRGKRVLWSAGIVLLALAMLFGCARVSWDDSQQSGWYIQLNVGDPGAKGIGVDYHDVTGLEIMVYDPDDQLRDEIEWDAVEGPQSYVVQVNQEGTHRIEVTHISDGNGETVEATETAEFDVEPMVITVIEITPGAVGEIGVEGEIPDPWAWLYDFWVQEENTAPYSQCLEVRADGTWFFWDRYDGTGDSGDNGTWYTEGDLMYIVAPEGTVPTEVTRVNENEIIFVAMDDRPFYRRGTEPGGWVFDQEATELQIGDLEEGSISDIEKHLYSFQAPYTGSFEIYWRQSSDDDPPVYTARVAVSAYEEDQSTPIFEWEDTSGYSDPKTVELALGEVIYIIVEGWEESGSYGIWVMAP